MVVLWLIFIFTCAVNFLDVSSFILSIFFWVCSIFELILVFVFTVNAAVNMLCSDKSNTYFSSSIIK